MAACRTFILEEEAAELRRQGIGAHAAVTDLLVFGPGGPIGNRLRYANEPARHKILDLVGDLSLLGHELTGHLVAYRSGHPLNIEFVQAQTINNKKRLEEKDPAVRAANFDQLRATAADPERHRQFLLRTSLLESVRKAGVIG